jgi:ribosomal protein L15
MSDDPFAAFKEGQPPAVDDLPKVGKEKKTRKKKIPPKKTAANPPVADKEATREKTERKTRKPRAAKELKLPISTLLEIGHLSEEESGALISIGAGLQKLGKKSRGRIVAALSKIF